MTKLRFTAACIALLATSMSAQSALVELDLKSPGDGWITLDTKTGLEWLDLNRNPALPFYTQEEYFSKVQAEFPSFRQATKTEVLSLFTSAGVCTPSQRDPLLGVKGCNAKASAVTRLQGLIGLTLRYQAGYGSYGGDPAPIGWFAQPNYLSYGIADYKGTTEIATMLGVGQGSQWGGAFAIERTASLDPAPNDASSPYTVFWMVRNATPPVPEPSTFVLLALGLGAIAFARRRRAYPRGER